jgi:hypothetical protein
MKIRERERERETQAAYNEARRLEPVLAAIDDAVHGCGCTALETDAAIGSGDGRSAR